MKRLIVCSDGTWNKPEQQSGGRIRPTNVVKMARAISPSDSNGVAQVVFYDQGVGTEGSRAWELLGGGFGLGLSKNVKDGYRFLMHNYEDGDQIYLFGFSRGAYTVRSLVGLIRNAGLLHRVEADKFGEAYRLYRDRDDDPDSPRAVEFRKMLSREVEIHFLGVWDTGGALGVPPLGFSPFLRTWVRRLFNEKYEFHDVELSGIVKHGYQALAIDEMRAPFEPAIWEPRKENGIVVSTHPKPGQTIEQVWFVGYHSDVGGGTSGPGLSDVTFDWMMEQADDNGLAFDPEYVSAVVEPKPLGRAHDSRSGIFKGVGTFVRTLGEAWPQTEAIHSAVMERLNKMSPRYSPSNLETYIRKHPDSS